jgi:hypothetical protein
MKRYVLQPEHQRVTLAVTMFKYIRKIYGALLAFKSTGSSSAAVQVLNQLGSNDTEFMWGPRGIKVTDVQHIHELVSHEVFKRKLSDIGNVIVQQNTGRFFSYDVPVLRLLPETLLTGFFFSLCRVTFDSAVHVASSFCQTLCDLSSNVCDLFQDVRFDFSMSAMEVPKRVDFDLILSHAEKLRDAMIHGASVRLWVSLLCLRIDFSDYFFFLIIWFFFPPGREAASANQSADGPRPSRSCRWG